MLPGYFETMRTPILEGRAFTEADNVPERNVAIVDQVLAAKAFPRQSAVGKRILIRIRTPQPEWVDIVGVVAHQRETSLADPGREQIYFTDGFVGSAAFTEWACARPATPRHTSNRSPRRDRANRCRIPDRRNAAHGSLVAARRRRARASRSC